MDKLDAEIKRYIDSDPNTYNAKDIHKLLLKYPEYINYQFISNIVEYMKGKTGVLAIINGIYHYDSSLITDKVKDDVLDNIIYFPSHTSYSENKLEKLIDKFYSNFVSERITSPYKYLLSNIDKYDNALKYRKYFVKATIKKVKTTSKIRIIEYLNFGLNVSNFSLDSKEILSYFTCKSNELDKLKKIVSNEIYFNELYSFDEYYIDLIIKDISNFTKEFVEIFITFLNRKKYKKLENVILHYLEKYKSHDDYFWIISKGIFLNITILKKLLKVLPLNKFIIYKLYEYGNFEIIEYLFTQKVFPDIELLKRVNSKYTLESILKYDIFLSDECIDYIKEYLENFKRFAGQSEKLYIENKDIKLIFGYVPFENVEINKPIIIDALYIYYFNIPLTDAIIKKMFNRGYHSILYSLYNMGKNYKFLRDHFTFDNIIIINCIKSRIFYRNIFFNDTIDNNLDEIESMNVDTKEFIHPKSKSYFDNLQDDNNKDNNKENNKTNSIEYDEYWYSRENYKKFLSLIKKVKSEIDKN